MELEEELTYKIVSQSKANPNELMNDSELGKALLNKKEGTLSYHCTGGKDRTGITTLYLYTLLYFIDAHYIYTYIYILVTK